MSAYNSPPRDKAIQLINRFGFDSARSISYNMIQELGHLALVSPNKNQSDDIKESRFYWDVVNEIINKEWHLRKSLM